MKRSILGLAAFTLIAGTTLTMCNTPAEKVADVRHNVVEANKDLAKANEEYLADIEHNRKVTNEKAAANEKSIAEFKERIAHEKKDDKAEYKHKIAELERENSDMKLKMDDYKADGREQWETFKTGFNHDMEKLDQSIKNLTSSK